MNFRLIQQSAKILIDLHGLYFGDKDVLTQQNKEYRLNNLKIMYEYFKEQKIILRTDLNIFLRNNARSKNRDEIEKVKVNKASLDALFNYVSFLVGKCCLIDDKAYAEEVLNYIPADWEIAYAAKLLSFQINEQVLRFVAINDLSKVLDSECSKVKEKFTNCFNDFNLIKRISKQRSKSLQCLLYLLVRTVDNVLSLLQVDFNENERKVAHYTSLFGFRKLICEDSPLRLASGDLMNDPSEGRLLYEFLSIESELADDTFLTSFTFNHNSLNQFRLYGCTDDKEGTGISLVVGDTFFSSERNGFISSEITGDSEIFKILTDHEIKNLPLFRCIYFDKNTGFIQIAKRSRASFYQEYVSELELSAIHNKCIAYDETIEKLEIKLYTQIQILKKLVTCVQDNFRTNREVNYLLKITLRPLCFLFKHIAFQEEQECRIFYITDIGNSILEKDAGSMVVFYPYEAKIKDSLKNVYLGPALQNKFTFVRKEVSFNTDIKVSVCDSPFVSK